MSQNMDGADQFARCPVHFLKIIFPRIDWQIDRLAACSPWDEGFPVVWILRQYNAVKDTGTCDIECHGIGVILAVRDDKDEIAKAQADQFFGLRMNLAAGS